MAKQKPLAKFEKEYVELFGRFYEKRGMPNALGQIYAILALRASTPEEGMVQQDIASLVDRSISAVSRLLAKLEEMKFCEYTETINPNNRRERKYYLTTDVKEIALRRFKQIIYENQELQRELTIIREDMKQNEKSDNKEFVEFLGELETQIEKLITFYEKAIIMSKDIL